MSAFRVTLWVLRTLLEACVDNMVSCLRRLAHCSLSLLLCVSCQCYFSVSTACLCIQEHLQGHVPSWMHSNQQYSGSGRQCWYSFLGVSLLRYWETVKALKCTAKDVFSSKVKCLLGLSWCGLVTIVFNRTKTKSWHSKRLLLTQMIESVP